jgi:hypothetical protein
LEFALLHFPYYKILNQAQKESLKEADPYRAKLIKIRKAITALIDGMRSSNNPIVVDFFAIYSSQINSVVKGINTYQNMISSLLYFKLKRHVAKKYELDHLDIFLEIVFRLFGVYLPSCDEEAYELNHVMH